MLTNADDLLDLCRAQLGMDQEDFAEYEDLMAQYLDEGFLKMYDRYKGGAIGDVTGLPEGGEIPLPVKYRSAIADYACFLYYRNGNQSKQARGTAYLERFTEVYTAMRSEEAESANASNGGKWKMRNLYTQ